MLLVDRGCFFAAGFQECVLDGEVMCGGEVCLFFTANDSGHIGSVIHVANVTGEADVLSTGFEVAIRG